MNLIKYLVICINAKKIIKIILFSLIFKNYYIIKNMKTWSKTMFKFILLILLPMYLLSDNKPIIFAPLMTENVENIYTHFFPTIKYLEKKLNRKIELDYNTNYEELIKKFVDGKIDIAYLGPLPFLELEKEYSDAIPLVNFKNKNGDISYNCSFVSFITNDFPPEDMKNTKIALTQALSTCGYIFVNYVLKEANINIENNKYKYLGRHDKVALSVITDKYKYGGLKTDIAEKYYHLGLKEIKRSAPIPSFVLVANAQTLDENTISDIKNIMLSIDDKELSLWDKSLKYGVKETNTDDYKNLRESLKSIKIPSESNFDE